MAQPPHKPEPKPEPKSAPKSEPPTKSEEDEVEVKLPGEAPKANLVPQQHQNNKQHLSPATQAEQDAGKKATELATERLKAEQDAGAKIISHNEGKDSRES